MSEVFRKVASGISFSKGRPVLDIWSRDKDNKRRCIKVYDLPCYFYVPEDEYIEEEDMKQSVLKVVSGYKSLYGQALKKVVVKKISEVRRLGRLYHGFESDVKWDKKALLDLKITDMFVLEGSKVFSLDERFNILNDVDDESSTIVYSDTDKEIVKDALKQKDNLLSLSPDTGNSSFEVRHCIFDIEVVVDNREQLSTYEGKIVCVVMYDSYTGEYFKFKLETTERDLIIAVLEKFRDLSPDLISGWSVEFDMSWIIERANAYDIDLSLYFEGGGTFISYYTDHEGNSKKHIYLGGRTLVDGMELYKKKTMTTEKLSSYNLKTVAHVEGLDDWEDFGAQVKEMWAKESDKVVDYCKIDVERTMQILVKKDLLGGAETICKFYGCGFDDVTVNSRVIDCMGFLLKGNRILPNIIRGREKPKIKGATVLETKSGIHKNVGIFDAKSLYPSIIKGLNISPECLRSGEEYKTGAFKGNVITVKINEVEMYLLKKEVKMGLMTEVIIEMQKLRETIRENRQKAVEAGDKEKFALLNNEEKVTKGVLASVYGVMGFNGFRLYNEDCANIITMIARGTVDSIKNNIESEEAHVLYGDTDSVFIKCTDIAAGIRTRDKINVIVYDYVKSLNVEGSVITVSFEKFFKWIMFTKKIAPKRKSKLWKVDKGSAKKKYIGFISHVESTDGEMKEVNELYYRGFELRRSDSATVLKDVMRQFFYLMEDGDYTKPIEWLREVKKKFNSGAYTMDYVSMPRSVNNEEAKGPWPDGLRYSKEHLKFEFESETMPRLIYVKDQRTWPKTKVLCYQPGHVIPEAFKIDYDTMFNKIIKAKFEPIIESLGLFWDTELNNQGTIDTWC